MELKTLEMSELEAKVAAEKRAITGKEGLEAFRRAWLGKEGTIKLLLKQLGTLTAEERPTKAAKINQLRDSLEQFISSSESTFVEADRKAKLASEHEDQTLPGLTPGLGMLNPITQVERKIMRILRPFGFRSVAGPEVETEYYCFDALNIPQHHPARDMQDTFYLNTGHVLRTHTTSVQARELSKKQPPVKVASFGRAYRNETEDASHQAMFHQFELVWLEEGMTLANLMGLIVHIMKGLYGKRRKVRFVPKFYPYTEPSIGVQIDDVGGEGSLMSSSGWVTVGGAGMIHRNVLKEFSFDPEKVTGFAFGLGTSRLAQQLLEVPKLKNLYDGDLRMVKEDV